VLQCEYMIITNIIRQLIIHPLIVEASVISINPSHIVRPDNRCIFVRGVISIILTLVRSIDSSKIAHECG
jgi:hypothetical protein